MTREEVGERVRALIAAIAPEPRESVPPGADLIDDLRYNSVALIEWAVALEQAFQRPPLDDERIFDIRTVADVEQVVCALAVGVSP